MKKEIEDKNKNIGTLSTAIGLGKSVTIGEIEIVIKELRLDRATIIIKAPKNIIIKK